MLKVEEDPFEGGSFDDDKKENDVCVTISSFEGEGHEEKRLKTESKKHQYHCQDCNLTFTHYGLLMRHAIGKHVGSAINRRHNRLLALRLDLNGAQRICALCSKPMAKRQNLLYHLLSVHT